MEQCNNGMMSLMDFFTIKMGDFRFYSNILSEP
jgi:hypothetical protein